MSSAMVSTLLNDDLTAIQRNFHDFPLLQRNSAVDKAELVGSAFSVCGLLAGGGSIARRHSSSIFVSAPAKPVTNIPSFADSNNALVNNGILETVAEERFRSRAYSEGSSILSCDQQQQQPNQSTSRYKTELCRPFEENGRCKYGDKCQFAHGKHEMRQMVRHPKYKTELCRTYHTDGICPYGPRCHFIHNTDDPAAMPRQNSMNGIGMQSQPMSMPVAINNQASQKRPTNLQLMSQHRTVSRLNSFPAYTPSKVNHSPIGTPPGFYGLSERPMLSPVSPNTNVRTGPVFSFSKAPMSPLDMQTTNVFGGYESISTENRQGTPPLSRFDIFTQGTQLMDLSAAEDGVFERPISPPDSDRESESGSPQGSTGAANNSPQRLPIFRCLSQSD